MKLIFCLFKYFPYGGLQKNALAMAKACVLLGHEVEILTSSWEGEKPTDMTLTVLPIRSLTLYGWSRKFIQAAQRHFSLHTADLILGFNRIPGIDMYYAADRCYAEKYHLAHWFKKINPRYRGYATAERLMCLHPHTELLLLTPQEKTAYLRYYPLDPVNLHVLPPGIMEEINGWVNFDEDHQHALKQQYEVPIFDKLILFVGSAFKTKGLDRALHAIASLPEAMQQKIHFFVVGSGKSAPYQRLIRSLKLKAEIKFLGGRQDVTQLMRAADLLLHPARDENAGNVLIEAMNQALPILTTDACGYTQYVVKAKAGRSVALPFHQEALNEELLQLLTHDTMPMRQAGLDFCREHPLNARLDMALTYIEAALHRPKFAARFKGFMPAASLTLQDGTCIQLEHMLRVVPNKRWVVRANFQGQVVVTKIFAHERKYRQELAGITRCLDAGVVIPRVLATGRVNGNLFVVVFEYVEKDHTLEAQDLVDITAEHHNLGVMQADIHVDNFIKRNNQVVTLDAAEITAVKNPLDNLALLLAQFWSLDAENIKHYLQRYCALRHTTPVDVASFIKKVEDFKIQRKHCKIKTLFRNSSSITAWQEKKYRLFLRNDAYTAQLCAHLHDWAAHLNGPHAQWSGDPEYVAKAYPVVEARKRWRDAHLAEFTDAPDCIPVALIEQRNLFKNTGYFIYKPYIKRVNHAL